MLEIEREIQLKKIKYICSCHFAAFPVLKPYFLFFCQWDEYICSASIIFVRFMDLINNLNVLCIHCSIESDEHGCNGEMLLDDNEKLI